jgi:hypothetical protein
MDKGLVTELYESDAASALTNRAARKIESLEAQLANAIKMLEVLNVSSVVLAEIKGDK